MRKLETRRGTLFSAHKMVQNQTVDQSQFLESLIKKYSKPLVRYATGILRDTESAKEVVQDCFLKVHQQSSTELKIPSWLYREVRFRCIDLWRKRRKVEPINPGSEPVSDQPSPLDGLEARQNLEYLIKHIEQLPLRDQEILRLKYGEGLSYQQIGEVMDLTASNVGFILFQAVKAVRDATGSVDQGMAKKYGE